MSKADYAEFKFNSALIEDDDFDMLVMGRTQGKGCYCFVNGLLQAQLAKLQNNYPYMVVDNEAGMEHISRGVLPTMQTAILVSDCSRRGIQAVGRIKKLIEECDMHPQQIGLIVNRAPNGVLNEGTKEEIEIQGLNLLGVVPQDELVYEYDCEGRPTVELPEDSPVRKAMDITGDIFLRSVFARKIHKPTLPGERIYNSHKSGEKRRNGYKTKGGKK